MALGRVASATDPGRKRRRNEDAFIVAPPIFAIADGMGGAQAGEVASRLTVGAIKDGGRGEGSPEDRVVALIEEANRRVHQRSSEDRAASGMGTTVTLAIVEDGTVTIGHVGDSRAYLLRDGKLEQVTHDHSLVAELVRSGKLSPEEAEGHPQRSVITRALGTEADIDVDVFPVEARDGDLFLLCSDGLSTMVDDAAIETIVKEKREDLDAAARALVAAANKGGGEDNITVVCFEIVPEGAASAYSPPATAPPDEEEDTLSGVEAVPVLEPTGPPVDWDAEEWQPVEPRRRRRRRRGRRLVAALIVLALLAVAAGLALWGLSRSHFVGAEKDGHVAVYQGVPYDLFGGARLYRSVYVSKLVAAQLSQDERRKLFNHDLIGKQKALAKVKTLEQELTP